MNVLRITKLMSLVLIMAASMSYLPTLALAQEKAKEEEEAKEEGKYRLEEVTVTATGVTDILWDFPGTVHVITEQDIEEWHPTYSQQLLERVPGVIALSEEEAGLRPSIGIRGLNPLRSRGGVVLLRDGIPFNPAPYADPGAYYNVPMQRIERIEVMKGGSSILYGPNAVGGVVNYITKSPPETPEFWSRQTFGTDSLWVNELSYGGTWGDLSGFLAYSRRQSDGFRDNSEFFTDDVSTKWIWRIGDGSDIGIHFNYYQEPDTRMPKGISPAQFKESIEKTRTKVRGLVSTSLLMLS
ncbi:MAG: TonB-dependent receptor family protein [Candidatus Binatia bacterium]